MLLKLLLQLNSILPHIFRFTKTQPILHSWNDYITSKTKKLRLVMFEVWRSLQPVWKICGKRMIWQWLFANISFTGTLIQRVNATMTCSVSKRIRNELSATFCHIHAQKATQTRRCIKKYLKNIILQATHHTVKVQFLR